MEFPMLKKVPAQRKTVASFGGLNRTACPGEGEFAKMENLTSDHFPTLTPRKNRGQVLLYEGTYTGKLLGFGYCCGFCYVLEDGSFHFGAHIQGGIAQFLDPATEKKLVAAGGKMLIFPDKKWVSCAELAKDVANEVYSGSLEARWEGNVTIKPLTDNKLQLTAEEVGLDFAVGDTVKLRMADSEALKWSDKHIWVGEVYEKTNNSLTVAAEPGYTLSAECAKYIIVSRKLPEMDFITECGNRLWGCRYGINTDGTFVNEIYCSKLGDFTNWQTYRGVSTDSYRVSVGVDGPFTGIATYLGRPVFFKENAILTVYGSYPAQYQLKVTYAPGVKAGCSESVAAATDRLYYLSREGVCVYDGALPEVISRKLGEISCTTAAAGTCNGKYYLSTDKELLVYDTRKNLWHREDTLQVSSFLTQEGKLYALERDGKNLWVLAGAEEKLDDYTHQQLDTQPVAWLAETGPLGLDMMETKRITALHLRLQMTPGSKLRVWLRYDFDPDWECAATVTACSLGTVRLPVRPKRCDHLYLRLEGQGDCQVYSITKVLRKGSDLP